MRIRIRWSMAAWLALAGAAACNSGTSSSPSADVGFTRAQANQFASQLAQAMDAALQHTQIDLAPANRTTLQPNGGISRVSINQPITSLAECVTGGSIAVSGSMAGDIAEATGDGMLDVHIVETISDWTCVPGYTIDGNPNLTATGAMAFSGFQPSSPTWFDITGSITWGSAPARACDLRLTVLVPLDGAGHVQGVVCGQPVDANY